MGRVVADRFSLRRQDDCDNLGRIRLNALKSLGVEGGDRLGEDEGVGLAV